VLTVCPGAIDTPFFDEQARRRMPEVAKRMMIEPARVVEATIRALRAGKYEVTVPPFIRAGYIVRALAPGIMRRNTKRVAAPPLA
jgi:short-subunit dehydrogenase